MPTIDLTTLAATAASSAATEPAVPPISAAPRRIGLTVRELQHAARLAGDAPLPFEVAPPTANEAIESRLGQSPTTTEDRAYRAVVDGLHDPAESLVRRGLLVDGELDAGLAGAVGLLAAPRLGLDLDVRMAGVQAKVWHRQDGHAVASLATVDGVAFEIGWFATDAWAAELARVPVVSEEVTLRASAVPSHLDLPFELAAATAEACRTGRGDLLPVLAARHAGSAIGPDGPLPDHEVARALAALASEAQGRLRAMVADVSGLEVSAVGVVSWTLLADGWHALRPHHDQGILRVELRRVEPADLAAFVAPLLGPVTSADLAEGRGR